MVELLVVGAGGFLGAVARWKLSGVVQAQVAGGFPAGTLVVNLAGCVLIGVVMALVHDRELFTAQTRLLLTVGFLGSLTTFSTFGHETLELLRGGDTGLALLSVAGNVVLGVGGVLSGQALVRAVA